VRFSYTILKIFDKKIIINSRIKKEVKDINIAVCDNNSVVIDNVSNLIEDFSESRHIEIKYSSFTDYIQLVDRINEFDLFILDYNMSDNVDGSDSEDKINGMEFAKTIRQHGGKKGIIFITAYPDFVYESFEVRTYRFLVKPIEKAKLFEAIQSYIDSVTESGSILVNINKEMYPVNIDDILYLEVSGKNTFIYTQTETIKCRKPITSFAKELKPFGICQVHRSYLVNVRKIRKFDTRTLILTNGEKIFVSQKYYPGLFEMYLQKPHKPV